MRANQENFDEVNVFAIGDDMMFDIMFDTMFDIVALEDQSFSDIKFEKIHLKRFHFQVESFESKQTYILQHIILLHKSHV